MKHKYGFICGMLLGILFVSIGLTTLYVSRTNTEGNEGEITIVTSFYPMYIAAMNVVGDTEGVVLSNLSEPQTGCLHDFQLTPEDMKLLSSADIFIINGGGLESFMEEIAADYPDLSVIEASKELTLLQGEDGENAHVWMSIGAYRTQVATIAAMLSELDPVHAAQYAENAKAYQEKLSALQKRQEEITKLANGTSIVLLHEAFAYLAADYGLPVSAGLNLDEERQVSAGEAAEMLAAIQEDDVQYTFAEELYGERMGDMLEAEAGVQVLYLDVLNRGTYDADSYLTGMQRNMELLEEAFEK